MEQTSSRTQKHGPEFLSVFLGGGKGEMKKNCKDEMKEGIPQKIQMNAEHKSSSLLGFGGRGGCRKNGHMLGSLLKH